MVYTKDKSVHLKVLTPAMMHILNTVFGMNAEETPIYPVDWVITSINDSVHMVNSKHYTDQAIDMRSKNFKNTGIKKSFVEIMQLRLGSKFVVILENLGKPTEHFHIQVRKGNVFP